MTRLYIVRRQQLFGVSVHSYGDLMLKTSSNTGNLFFADAIEKQLAADSFVRGQLGNIHHVSDQVDAIVIPAANWLSPHNSFLGAYADAIEKTNLPCTVVGLGVQAPNTTTTPRLNERTKKFLHVVSDRCHTIGVRGEFSAETLANNGIKNVSITGCPSLFWSLKPELKISPPPVDSDKLRIATNASRLRRVKANDKKLNIERQLYAETARRPGSFFVPQTEVCEIELAYSQNWKQVTSDAEAELADFLGFSPRELPPSMFRVFDNVSDWIGALSQVDFVIGTRLHGCIMGLMAGRPALLITIDSRTRELADFMEIPNCPVEHMATTLKMEELFERFDYSAFERIYPKRLADYRNFLSSNSLSVCF